MFLAETPFPVAPEEPLSDFGSWLKEMRKRRGLTLEALAEKAETTHPSISRLEGGRANPSRKMVEKLAAALEVDAAPGLLAAGFVPGQGPPKVRDTSGVSWKIRRRLGDPSTDYDLSPEGAKILVAMGFLEPDDDGEDGEGTQQGK